MFYFTTMSYKNVFILILSLNTHLEIYNCIISLQQLLENKKEE